MKRRTSARHKVRPSENKERKSQAMHNDSERQAKKKPKIIDTQVTVPSQGTKQLSINVYSIDPLKSCGRKSHSNQTRLKLKEREKQKQKNKKNINIYFLHG